MITANFISSRCNYKSPVMLSVIHLSFYLTFVLVFFKYFISLVRLYLTMQDRFFVLFFSQNHI